MISMIFFAPSRFAWNVIRSVWLYRSSSPVIFPCAASSISAAAPFVITLGSIVERVDLVDQSVGVGHELLGERGEALGAVVLPEALLDAVPTGPLRVVGTLVVVHAAVDRPSTSGNSSATGSIASHGMRPGA